MCSAHRDIVISCFYWPCCFDTCFYRVPNVFVSLRVSLLLISCLYRFTRTQNKKILCCDYSTLTESLTPPILKLIGTSHETQGSWETFYSLPPSNLVAPVKISRSAYWYGLQDNWLPKIVFKAHPSIWFHPSQFQKISCPSP